MPRQTPTLLQYVLIDALKIGLASSRDRHCGSRAATSFVATLNAREDPSSLPDPASSQVHWPPTSSATESMFQTSPTDRPWTSHLARSQLKDWRCAYATARHLPCASTSPLRDNASPNHFYCHTDSSRRVVLKACVWEA